MELNEASMKDQLINKMGLLAIQKKQHEESAVDCQKEYEKLSAQVAILQELEENGVNLTPPKSEQDKQQEQS